MPLPDRLSEARYVAQRMALFCFAIWFGACGIATAQNDVPAPPSNVTAADTPNDSGGSISVSWDLSPDDLEGGEAVSGYEIFRNVEGAAETEFASVGEVERGVRKFRDDTAEMTNESGSVQQYVYQVAAKGEGSALSNRSSATGPVSSVRNWFNTDRLWILIILAVLSGAILGFIAAAQSGVKLKIRRIPALDSVDEAVGRATEMGRSCLFIPGIQDIDDLGTIAGISILARVSKTAAEYGADVEVPTARSLVMATCRETMQGAYLAAGRPDAYNPDRIYYVSDEQFAYVAHVSGKMVRERPAACFYFGAFFAESLIFAEMGNLIGAIQIAGTKEVSQLPFFVAACDYTLIGEEFFAASAYLSGEPQQLGSLKGQDVGKTILGICVIIGVLLATLASVIPDPDAWYSRTVDYMSNTVFGSGGGE